MTSNEAIASSNTTALFLQLSANASHMTNRHSISTTYTDTHMTQTNSERHTINSMNLQSLMNQLINRSVVINVLYSVSNKMIAQKKKKCFCLMLKRDNGWRWRDSDLSWNEWPTNRTSKQLTDGDGVDFALYLNGGVLTLVDVHRLLHLRLTDHQVPVVLVELLQHAKASINRLPIAIADYYEKCWQTCIGLPHRLCTSHTRRFQIV